MTSPELHDLALQKLERVFGTSRGPALLTETLREAGLVRIRTPEDLLAVGVALERRGGIEAGVGGILKVQAALRGARPGT
jgi:hypothetical protein